MLHRVPMLAATATVTEKMKRQIVKTLDMRGCKFVNVSPNKPNVFYSVEKRIGDIGKDLSFLVSDLLANNIKAIRTIVYCQSLDTCANLYIYFHSKLGDASYFPPGADNTSDNRLFGMFHAKTDDYNKSVIFHQEGTVRVVFATMALGMGVNFKDLTCIVHYGAPRSLEDYFQESGRAGRGGELSTSTIYWSPSDVPNRKDKSNPRNVELDTVRGYLLTTECRRQYLLQYFDPGLTALSDNFCCDNCKVKKQTS